MLIDLKNDPRELTNCVDKVEYREDLLRMKKLLAFLPSNPKALPEY